MFNENWMGGLWISGLGQDRTFVDRCSSTDGRPKICRQRTLIGRRDADNASTVAVPVT
jgi:hypothetical protein